MKIAYIGAFYSLLFMPGEEHAQTQLLLLLMITSFCVLCLNSVVYF